MKTFINQSRFIKAAEYVSKNFFSKPFSITPVVDRWFNQYAVVEIEYYTGMKRKVEVPFFDSRWPNYTDYDTGEVQPYDEMTYIDIILDGKVVPREDIKLIQRFESNSKKQSYNAEKTRLENNITELNNQISQCEKGALKADIEHLQKEKESATERLQELLESREKTAIEERILKINQALEKQKDPLLVKKLNDEKINAEEKLQKLIADLEKSDDLYLDIKIRGQSMLNERRLEKDWRAKITKIIYRPNHDLNHSVRAAYMITAIHAYKTQCRMQERSLTERDLEKLQMMMLFSVVGRKDETGFSETIIGDRTTYESYRATSGKEFLKYFQANKALYGEDWESIFKDAIIVELMGYRNIAAAQKNRLIPELLISYVMAKEMKQTGKIPKDRHQERKLRIDARQLIMNGTYSLNDLFPAGSKERELADSKLDMMNQAHGIDLVRCYPLTMEGVAESNNMFENLYNITGGSFYDPQGMDLQQLTSIYQIINCAFSAMRTTGQTTTFGFMLPEDFEKQKIEILKRINAVNSRFNIPAKEQAALISEAKNQLKNIQLLYSGLTTPKDQDIFDRYYEYCLTKEILTCFTKDIAASSDPTLRLFSHLHIIDGDPHKVDHYRSAASLVQSMETITPVNGVERCEPPLVSAVKHGRDENGQANGQITAFFDTEIQANQFRDTCEAILNITPLINEHNGQLSIQIDTKGFEQLRTTGLIELRLPIIAQVVHERNKEGRLTGIINLAFDKEEEAEHFISSYVDLFPVKAPMMTHNGQYHIQINRAHYKQMVKEQRVEFKLVTVPKGLSRENELIKEDGAMDVLDLIKHSRAVVRLVSTTALNGEDFPDYEYYLNALEEPTKAKNRYSSIASSDAVHFKYTDPRTREVHQRTVSKTPMPLVRFQEPVYKPVSMKEKLEEGWVVGDPTGDRNTIFTKKMPHSLLPPHGKMIPYEGYLHTKSVYFPIGFLSDRLEVDMKDERYVWSMNMRTASKFWLNNSFEMDKKLFEACGAVWDPVKKDLLSDESGHIVFRRPELTHESGETLFSLTKGIGEKGTVLGYYKDRADINGNTIRGKINDIIAILDEIHFHPSVEILHKVKKLITQERDLVLNLNCIKNSPTTAQEVEGLFQQALDRVDLEINSQNPDLGVDEPRAAKYGITLRQLVRLQEKQGDAADNHNELLLANTKAAVRAMYTPKDGLFERLNLAFHAMKIKEKYRLDIPLMVLSKDKSPYHYTEAMIKADILDAYKRLQYVGEDKEQQFPYDRSEVDAYVFNTTTQKWEVEKDERGHAKKIPKNLAYQQSVLVELFKIGMPQLETIDQLVKGEISGEKLEQPQVENAIATIVTKMDLLGGLARETQLMQKILASGNLAEREKFALRAAALGHQTLVEQVTTPISELTPETNLTFLSNISMQVIGGFMAVIGASAVAIAFVTLNAATFGVAGLITASLGTVSILGSVGLFATYRNAQVIPPDEPLNSVLAHAQ